MTTPELLSDEEIARFRAEVATRPNCWEARLLDEHARLKATVERVRALANCTEFVTPTVKGIREALSPDASTTETKP